jgi:hypothetical protein
MTFMFDNPPACAPIQTGDRADSLVMIPPPFSVY